MSKLYLQRTIASCAEVSGYGYWSGRDVRVEFRPAAAGRGISFVRRDIASELRIPARPDCRGEAPRRTNLSFGPIRVDMVEHILAALAGLAIDNCEVWVDAQEMPGCDGSSAPFASALQRAGIVEQEAVSSYLEVLRPLRVGDEQSWIEAHPSKEGEFRIEFRLDYPNCPAIGRQTSITRVAPAAFMNELASCRTFVLESEAEEMLANGLGTRVTRQDLLIFGADGPIDNSLRFANECARHKALDVLGDLALTGRRLIGNFIANRSGHRLNARLAAQLLQQDAADATHVAA